MKPVVVVFALAFAASTSNATTYSQDVKPILDANCIECHNGVNQDPDLRSFPFNSQATWDQSIIVADILSKLNAKPPLMPPGNRTPLTAAQVSTIQEWSDGGLAP